VLSETVSEFDLGPLSWVQGEIDGALTRGSQALGAFRANPADGASLKHARSHVHQAAGAIQMVGLDAVVAFTDEIERHLVHLEELPHGDVGAAVDLVDHAISRLKVFLDEVANGAPPVPLTLFNEYEAMQRARANGDFRRRDAPADGRTRRDRRRLRIGRRPDTFGARRRHQFRNRARLTAWPHDTNHADTEIAEILFVQNVFRVLRASVVRLNNGSL